MVLSLLERTTLGLPIPWLFHAFWRPLLGGMFFTVARLAEADAALGWEANRTLYPALLLDKSVCEEPPLDDGYRADRLAEAQEERLQAGPGAELRGFTLRWRRVARCQRNDLARRFQRLWGLAGGGLRDPQQIEEGFQ